MSGKRRWLLVLLAVLVIAGASLVAAADSGTESEFLSLINSTRADKGLGSLQVDGGLQAHARNHTQAMIESGGIYHSSDAELSAAAGSGWSRVGENVGRGQSPSSLHSAFMASPGHQANIVGDYNYVGIGTGSADGYLYVTVVFMKKGETGPTPTEAPPPTEAPGTTSAPAPGNSEPAPASTTTTTPTTTTTLPPTTTTTLIVPPDKAVVAGQTCIEATRYSSICQN